MNPAAHSIESILAAAVELPSEAERRAFVARTCAGDTGLKQRVEELIENHLRAGSFLESPAPPLVATDETPVRERPGSAIGPYKLMEQIGAGGMGLVFVAEQQQPVRRKVALKVVKPGLDTREVIARFEAERQALALMDHPNIARVLDAGTTASGRPYFVMELVKGVPITEFCDDNRLTPRERLGLFVSVCQAVQHAHQKGVIHRDVKPSNVLVTSHDGTPVVKVIDFGIAKAVDQRLTEKTVYTGFMQLVGTPMYMSPEQASMSGLDIDTRTDIYALGVLLYELLTGTTPFEEARFERASYDEMRRIIREEEPPRPSARISVGPRDQEVYTDKYGRVKVQFHWDRNGTHGLESSCWVRVAQPWAGKRWGASFWPRIGQEVVVAFLEGDPDQPIIVGSVYNAEQMPPYLGQGLDAKHPSDNKLCGIKSNSTPGGQGYNEWRFDDTKDKEQIFLHAERNLDVRVKNDSLERVYGNRHQIVGWEKDGQKGGDQRELVYQDKHLHVKRHQEEHIEGSMKLLIGHGEAKDDPGNLDVVVENVKSELIGACHFLHLVDSESYQQVRIEGDQHFFVGRDRREQVDGSQSLTVGKDQQEQVVGKHALAAGQEIHFQAGQKVVIEAGVELTLRGPGGFVKIDPSGVYLNGLMVYVNSGGKAGAGSGSNPTPPDYPDERADARMAKPVVPALADDSVSGSKSVPAAWPAPQPGPTGL